MRRLPLYPDGCPTAPVEGEPPIAIDPDCGLCKLSSRRIKTICIPPEGVEGKRGGDGRVLLVVGDKPGEAEDTCGRPFRGESGAWLRRLVGKHWSGPIFYDLATRCWTKNPKKKPVKPEHAVACRGYLAETIRASRPERILALGNHAFRSILGRAPDPESVRRGYGWLAAGGREVPVFLCLAPVTARRSRFTAQWLAEDIEWALGVDVATLRARMPWTVNAHAKVVETVEDAERAVAALRGSEWITYDLEWSGERFVDDDFEIVCASVVGAHEDHPYVWPVGSSDGPTFAPLLDLLCDPSTRIVGQSGKDDALAIKWAFGRDVAPLWGDAMHWRRLLDPKANAGLAVTQELVGMGGGKEDADRELKRVFDLICKSKKMSEERLAEIARELDRPVRLVRAIRDAKAVKKGKGKFKAAKRYLYGAADADVTHRYCARDALSHARVAEHLLEKFEDTEEGAGPWRLWQDVFGPADAATVSMEAWGFAFDRERLVAAERYFARKEAKIAARFAKYDGLFGKDPKTGASIPFNPDATAHVRLLLFDHLGIEPLGLTPSEKYVSTDAKVLEVLARTEPVAQWIIDYRSVRKLRSTYAVGLQRHVAPDGRIHSRTKTTGTETGRVASEEPNLQNLPTCETEDGVILRSAAVAKADPSWRTPHAVLLEMDESQVELRMLAELSGDEIMLDVYARGEDLHLRTAQLVAKGAWATYSDAEKERRRQISKATNFGIVFGKSAGSLARELGISRKEAERTMDNIFGAYVQMGEFRRAQIRYARKHGSIRTFWKAQPALRRDLPAIAFEEESDEYFKGHAERQALNSPVQGSAAHVCVAAYARVVEWILRSKVHAKVVSMVHDSVITECADYEFERVYHAKKRIMEDFGLRVPLKVDAKVGLDWGHMLKVAVVDGELCAIVEKEPIPWRTALKIPAN